MIEGLTLAEVYPSVIAAITIWREARGESFDAQRGVAWVIYNRMNDPTMRWPRDATGVCQQRFQFSCWLDGDPNFYKFPHVREDSFVSCCRAWEEMGDDLTKGANHYHSFSDPDNFPKWADVSKVTTKIGAFTFYRL